MTHPTIQELFDLTGEVALVTGGARNLGYDMATALAEAGADVTVAARSFDQVQETSREIETLGRKCLPVKTDVTSRDDVDALIGKTVDKFGGIDILINNAGFGGVGVFHELDYEQHINMINLNVTSLTAMTRLFLPDFVERNSGKILNTSSTASLTA